MADVERIAEEIGEEIHRVLGSTLPEDLVAGDNRDIVCGIFADAFDRHGIDDETSGERILAYVPRALADRNRKFAELNRQLDIAVGQTVGTADVEARMYRPPSPVSVVPSE